MSDNHKKKNVRPLSRKVAFVLFAYLYIYQSKFSTKYKGKHISIISESDDGKRFEVLNTSNSNPNDYNFRGQLIRMELPLISHHNKISWTVYFEKLPYQKKEASKAAVVGSNESNKNDEKGSVFIKCSLIENILQNNSDFVRVKITNFDKFISMNMENDATKSVIIEVKKSEILGKSDIMQQKKQIKGKNDGNDNDEDDDKSDFDTEDEDQFEANEADADYDSNDDRYVSLEKGAPFVSGEYYFIGIISNKVDTFDTDTNNYHLDGFGIDSATDYIYLGEGNNVIDTEELDDPYVKPAILNLDVVKVECDMVRKRLTFYKNGERFGPKDKDYTMSFNFYGAKNKQWYPAVCIVNKFVKAVFEYND